MTSIGVAFRLLLLGLCSLVLVPLQMLALRFQLVVHAACAAGVVSQDHPHALQRAGDRARHAARDAPTIVVSNHVSWLDIPVIGSLHPLSFIAKSEVEGWPVIGLFARLQRSVFIDRQRRKATVEVNDALAHRLVKGEALVLFAEGTTSDGNRLLPFRSSLVGAAQTALMHDSVERVFLQPLAIAYTSRNGLPVTRRERPFIAWYGDMDLGPHLKLFIRGIPLDVVVTWGEPIPFNGSRKQATAFAEAEVRRALKAA